MSPEVAAAVTAIDLYAGAAGEPSVAPLGTVAIPVKYLQALRRALEAK